MRKTGRLKRDPIVKPVRSIEVPVKATKKKILLIAALLAVGITLIVFAVVKLLSTPKGWQVIEAPSGLTDTYAYDFTLSYLIGESDQKANRERNSVSELYVKASGDAYRIFSENEIKDVKNIYYINHHPSETIQIAPELYKALTLITADNNRVLYLGPIYENNRELIACEDDFDAVDYDPRTDAETAQMYEKLLAYVQESDHVNLQLLGDNQVCLEVSPEYRAYAKEIGTDAFIALDWMRSAFVTDYIADTLIAKGYRNGFLSSYDGYTRYLDNSGRTYEYTIHDGSVNSNYRAATMEFSKVGAVVWLRGYPISADDLIDYYPWETGYFTTSRLDPADGLDKAVCGDFVAYSRSLSCAEILVQAMHVYVADEMDWEALSKLPGTGVEYVVVHDKTIYASDKNVKFSNKEYGDPKFALPGGEK